MVIETKKKPLRISQMRYISAIIFFPLIIVLLSTDLIKNTFLGFNKYHIAIIVASVYILQNVYQYLKDYKYIYFSDEEGKLVLRYVSLRPFNNKKYSIEINKNDLHSYKIKHFPLNFKQQLILFVHTPQGIAKYPPISITALSEDEFNRMKKILNDILASVNPKKK
jgi:hypothetical protein